MMTRKEMITACIEDQVAHGIVKPERKEFQIKARLTGSFRMSYSECKRWYDDVFGGEEQSGYTSKAECSTDGRPLCVKELFKKEVIQ